MQYDITQHPKLAAQLPAPLPDLLQVALQSHRDAIKLDQDNADALFNSGQVLNSLAEAISDSKHPGEDQLAQASTYLQEAIELFQRCLLLQELKYTELQEEFEQMMSGAPPAEPAQPDNNSLDPAAETHEPEQEQWAAIVEPVTKNTLVDSAIAQLDSLTTLCHILNYNPAATAGVGWVQEYSASLLQSRLPAYVDGSDRVYDAALSKAKFTCALNDLLYRATLVDSQIYQDEVAQAFGNTLDLSADPDGLCAKAEALTSLNTALADLPPQDAGALQSSLAARWKALSSALEALTAASKLPAAENLPKIHLARGDVEVQRWRLGGEPWGYSMAAQNGAMLLRNAQTYYRGAAALARRDGIVEEEREGVVREAIAAALEGQMGKLEQLKTSSIQLVVGVAQDMVEDGLVEGNVMSSLIA